MVNKHINTTILMALYLIKKPEVCLELGAGNGCSLYSEAWQRNKLTLAGKL